MLGIYCLRSVRLVMVLKAVVDKSNVNVEKWVVETKMFIVKHNGMTYKVGPWPRLQKSGRLVVKYISSMFKILF